MRLSAQQKQLRWPKPIRPPDEADRSRPFRVEPLTNHLYPYRRRPPNLFSRVYRRDGGGHGGGDGGGDGEMVQRLTYRKRHSYATKSNQTRVVKTPGGRLVYQYTKKRASGPKCPVTGKKIQGIPHLRPTEYKRSRLSRNRRTVNRPYGGVLSGTAVRERSGAHNTRSSDVKSCRRYVDKYSDEL
ncbi:hypothetical protein GUJ93_ZPchr0010g8347 [Zizania palustris]|uniref:60S ribosomal protein L34 n=1 Tax=Zizania palustris TaxID=103762 RepID=A0A8J5WF63_ZIZPA|nr:hypothetical protein GUJ93_ZPchr0010g8347 [Zizania palustris]